MVFPTRKEAEANIVQRRYAGQIHLRDNYGVYRVFNPINGEEVFAVAKTLNEAVAYGADHWGITAQYLS